MCWLSLNRQEAHAIPMTDISTPHYLVRVRVRVRITIGAPPPVATWRRHCLQFFGIAFFEIVVFGIMVCTLN